MKIFWLLISCLAVYPAAAQPPAGFANSVTLDEKAGFSGSLYVAFQQSPTGKRYSASFDGNIYINSNNSEKHISSLSGLPGVSGSFFFPDSNTCWYYNNYRVVVFKGDSIEKIIPAPKEIFYYYSSGTGRLFYFDETGDSTSLYEFTSDQFRRLKKIKLLSPDPTRNFITDTQKNIWRFENKNQQLFLYRFNESALDFLLVKSYPANEPLFIRGLNDENNFIASNSVTGKIIRYHNGNGQPTVYGSSCGKPGNICANTTYFPFAVQYIKNGIAELVKFTPTGVSSILQVHTTDPVTHLQYESGSNSWLGFTNNKPLQFFPHLKKYPLIFGNNASGVFALTADTTGRVWAAGYKGGLTIVDRKGQLTYSGKELSFLNGSASHGQYQYLICENRAAGLLQFDNKGNRRPLTSGTLGYYVYISRNKKKLYYGTANYAGLWEAPLETVEKGKPDWNKIDSSRGINIFNILTITEDTLGRIWCSHPKKGIAIYDPASRKAATWLIEKNETLFGAYAAVTDPWGTVWLGSKDKGLWYYNDYSKPAAPDACRLLEHPLLNNGKAITALALSQNWLIISASDKILLLQLDSFHRSHKIILRYLNPLEAAFSSVTEQNTLLVNQKDSTVWFSTGDMLYQWHLQQWLKNPLYKVRPEIRFSAGSGGTLKADQTCFFSAGTKNIDIHLFYHSPDLLPRYTRAALIKNGDSVVLPAASLEDFYSYKNIGSGDYTFIIEIFESDGSTSTYRYPIIIRKFLWQQWWFWALLAAAGIALGIILVNLRRKKQLAEQTALAREAQLQAYKSEQEKKMARFQLITLSNQFRPHFILNTLNIIGARMDHNPETEAVLSRLGESVSLIFSHSTEQKILHPFRNEWKLVSNIIHIHRLMYLKNLECFLPEENLLAKFDQVPVPMGILQIPVENALLHGLSNREEAPWQLSIEINERADALLITITDNGVGRVMAARLSNFIKHGTGTKNLNEMIDIINANNQHKITLTYTDGIFESGGIQYGTRLHIHLPKQLTYEY